MDIINKRRELYELINELPEETIPGVKKYIKSLIARKNLKKEKLKEIFTNPPIDDEPWTEEDETDWQTGIKEVAEGKVITWEKLQEEL
jgi:hypothetical protein